MGFNSTLDAFEPNVRGTRFLLDLAFASPNASRLRFLFVSSSGVAQAWPRTKGAYPEEALDDPTWSVGVGYGESKFVAEHVSTTNLKAFTHADRAPC
jgi:nucleoside-diphosphate-sugar epimerase